VEEMTAGPSVSETTEAGTCGLSAVTRFAWLRQLAEPRRSAEALAATTTQSVRHRSNAVPPRCDRAGRLSRPCRLGVLLQRRSEHPCGSGHDDRLCLGIPQQSAVFAAVRVRVLASAPLRADVPGTALPQQPRRRARRKRHHVGAARLGHVLPCRGLSRSPWVASRGCRSRHGAAGRVDLQRAVGGRDLPRCLQRLGPRDRGPGTIT